jgi:hypothetical protein
VLVRAGAGVLAAGCDVALWFTTLSLAFSFRVSAGFAVTGMASTAVTARAKAERRIASGVIKLALDFIICSPSFITASRLYKATIGVRD